MDVDEGVEVDGVVVDDVVGLLITGASAQGPLICSRGYKCPRSFIVEYTAFCYWSFEHCSVSSTPVTSRGQKVGDMMSLSLRRESPICGGD